MENKEEKWLDKIIKTLLIRNFYRKFVTAGKHKIYLKNLYQYLKDDLNADWLKEKSFYTKARRIYQKLTKKYSYYKKNKELQKIQNKYKDLQIIEACYYLSLKGKFQLKNEDLEIFDEMLDIVFAKSEGKISLEDLLKNDNEKQNKNVKLYK